MNWLNKLEKIAAPIAVPGIIRYVAFLNAAAFVVGLTMEGLRSKMPLESVAVLKGEYWRIFTFAFATPDYGLLWIFSIMFLFYISNPLERIMGATRLTLYYLFGWLITIGSVFLFGGIGDSIYLNLTLLLAFATYMPDAQVSLYMIIPLKVKWVAIGILVLLVITAGGFANYVMLSLSLGNYLLFFGFSLLRSFNTQQQIAKRRHEFREKSRPDDDTLHQCKVCGRTEKSDPDLEFRVSSDGEEYCTEHLPSKTM